MLLINIKFQEFLNKEEFKMDTLISLLQRKDIIEKFKSVSSCEQGYLLLKQQGYKGSFEEFLDSLSYVFSCVCSCEDIFGSADQLYNLKK